MAQPGLLLLSSARRFFEPPSDETESVAEEERISGTFIRAVLVETQSNSYGVIESPLIIS